MLRTLISAIALVLVLTPVGSFAQDQQTESESGDTSETATEETQSDENTDGGLSMGRSEEQAVEVGQTYVREVFKDWELRCVLTEDGKDPCQLYQLLKDTGGNSVAEFNLFPLPPGNKAAAGATVITPLETLLTAELRLVVDAGKSRRYPYSFCTQIGCIARLGFTAEEITQFKRGNAGTVTIVPATNPDASVALAVSLSGFTAGYDALVATLAANSE